MRSCALRKLFPCQVLFWHGICYTYGHMCAQVLARAGAWTGARADAQACARVRCTSRAMRICNVRFVLLVRVEETKLPRRIFQQTPSPFALLMISVLYV